MVLTCLVIQFLLSFQISTPLLIGNLQYYFHFHHYYYHYSYHHYYYWYANDKTNLIGSQRPLLLTLRLELYSDRYPIKYVVTCMEMFKILRGGRGWKGKGGSPCSVLVGHMKTRASSPFDYTHNNSTLLKEGFVFNGTFDITTLIELKDHFVRKKKCNFAVLKQFPNHCSSLVLAGTVQAGVARAKAKKVYVYYSVFLFQAGTQIILHLLWL